MSLFFKLSLFNLSGRLVNVYEAFRTTLSLSNVYQSIDGPRFIFSFKDPEPRLVMSKNDGVDVNEDRVLFLHDKYAKPGDKTREHHDISVVEPSVLDVQVGTLFSMINFRLTLIAIEGSNPYPGWKDSPRYYRLRYGVFNGYI